MRLLSCSTRVAVAVTALFVVAACSDTTTSPDDVSLAPAFGVGNNSPTGTHYTLIIKGTESQGQGIGNGNGGQTIYVPLWGNAKILLTEGDPYKVLDADGRDGEAEFQLPNPDPDNDGETVYSVFARGLGQGSAKIALCADDPESDDPADVICNTGELVVTLEKGSGKGGNAFTNVSKELLYLWDVDIDGDGSVDYKRINLFNALLEGYFWSYDNWGLRTAQLRFYECSTDVGDESGDPIDDSLCFQ